jgi:hypothetical protein
MASRREDAKRPQRNDDKTYNGQGGGWEKDVGPAYQDATKTVASIFGGRATSKNRREQKLTARQIISVTTYDDKVTDLKYLNRSEHSITFSRADQWADIPYPGHFPLVLDPTIKGVRFQKVLIEEGSALNILFARSLAELGLKKEDLTPMDSPFWGIVPGKASQPLGQITLPVQFGTTKHFHTNYVNFLVADFNTAYHAILSRPALAKFMVVPHYTYLVLKMQWFAYGVIILIATYLSANPIFHARTKYIEVDYHFVQERVSSKLLEIKLTSSADQIANGFTKPLSIKLLEQIRSNLEESYD